MKLMESLRRPDWLKELQAVLILGLVVIGVAGVFGAAAVVSGESMQVELPASEVDGTVDYELREGAAVVDVQELRVEVVDPSVEQRVAWALTSLPTFAVVAAMLALLLRIVWRARRSDPFTVATVRRLRVLAVVALAGGYLGFLVEALAAMHLSSTVMTDGIVANLQLPLQWFLVGFGLFAVAEVVKRGCAMRAELETVV